MTERNLKGFRKAQPEEVQAIQLEILQDVLDFCSQEGIRVFMALGSLIGVIRHQGYIPWDDDIDIWMFREDYERFIETYNLNNEKYNVSAVSNNNKHPFPFAKISDTKTRQFEQVEGKDYNVGINIDLFPVDHLPLDVSQQVKMLKKWDRLKAIHTLKGINRNKKRDWHKNLILLLGNAMFGITKIETVCKKMDTLAQTYKNSPSEKVFTHEGRMVLDRAWFSETIMLPFENIKVPVPKEYDAILKKIYGNYMQLPPEDKRVAHHLYESFVADGLALK
ncbi:LicD family protein [Aerococcaceae bacterium NML180378]|nr:LicD family protein [Aerococcaceae bacterium NML180378]MDO4774936.1 LicD family protein [Aerococcaceae bacterium]